MTIIIGRKFAERILIGSDTMISDNREPRHNIIPGRLKAVVLTGGFSAAYAGLSDQAINAIRSAKIALSGSKPAQALQVLRAATEEHIGKLDFMVALHRPRAELRVIRNGVISDPCEAAALGDLAT